MKPLVFLFNKALVGQSSWKKRCFCAHFLFLRDNSSKEIQLTLNITFSTYLLDWKRRLFAALSFKESRLGSISGKNWPLIPHDHPTFAIHHSRNMGFGKINLVTGFHLDRFPFPNPFPPASGFGNLTRFHLTFHELREQRCQSSNRGGKVPIPKSPHYNFFGWNCEHFQSSIWKMEKSLDAQTLVVIASQSNPANKKITNVMDNWA